jgi:gentisate 1,2-dioxygenase
VTLTTRSIAERTAALDASLEALNVVGHWKSNSDGLPAEPRSAAQPFLWRWSDLYPRVLEAGEVLGIEGGASRRTLRLCNPGLTSETTTQTIHASVQMVKPGEIAESHRHSIGALRFVLQGAGGQTTVNGEPFIMKQYDLVLTPSGSWHEHTNDSAEPIIWIDGHDLPLVRALDELFFEPFGEPGPALPPSLSYAGTPHIFKGGEALAALDRAPASAWTPSDGRVFTYHDPLTGGPTLPTIGCRLHRFESGEQLQPRRETASTIYYVIGGTGTTRCGERVLRWQTGDIFVIPNWTWYAHAADFGENATLFSLSDAPMLDALGLLRSQSQER